MVSPELSGIAKLRQRIEALKNLLQNGVRYDDAQVAVVESSIPRTIQEVFGQNSPEFHDYQDYQNGLNSEICESEFELQKEFTAGIPQKITMLEGLIEQLEEKRKDLSSAETLSSRMLPKQLDLHPAKLGQPMQHVPVFVGSTFEDLKEYRDAVRGALHRLETIVRGMEYFGSKPGIPREESLKVVRSCKAYIGIFAMRYGSIDKETRKSFTHLECILGTAYLIINSSTIFR